VNRRWPFAALGAGGLLAVLGNALAHAQLLGAGGVLLSGSAVTLLVLRAKDNRPAPLDLVLYEERIARRRDLGIVFGALLLGVGSLYAALGMR
jgi:hypothetical protein